MATQRILDFLATRRPDGPCLIVDLDVVEDNFHAFRKALPDSAIFYAVKANPAPEILRLLASLGSNFDCASVVEIELAMNAGASASRISFGNTIKKERDIARAHALGVSLFAVDCVEEVEKIARAAPGARVFCRVLTTGEGARMAAVAQVRLRTADGDRRSRRGPRAGSQADRRLLPCRPRSRPTPTPGTAPSPTPNSSSRHWPKRGIVLTLVNMGGGFPTRYLKDVPAAAAYGQAIFASLRRHFGNRLPETIIEPGRGMVGDAGVVKAEVVLVSKKSDADENRWVYLDIGKFGGPRRDDGRGDPLSAGHPARSRPDEPPASSPARPAIRRDVLYEKTPYPLPISLTVGDEVLIEGTGAYTTDLCLGGVQRLRAAALLRDLRRQCFSSRRCRDDCDDDPVGAFSPRP